MRIAIKIKPKRSFSSFLKTSRIQNASEIHIKVPTLSNFGETSLSTEGYTAPTRHTTIYPEEINDTVSRMNGYDQYKLIKVNIG